MSEDVLDEFETKLVSVANSQLKLESTQSFETLLEKLQVVSEALRIDLSEATVHAVADEYFDDAELRLFTAGCSLRKRTSDGREPHLTLKSADETAVGAVLQRKELKITEPDAIQALLGDTAQLRRTAKEHGIMLPLELGSLHAQLKVLNDRIVVPAATKEATYQLNYDKYYYFAEDTGFRSEYHDEFEIEAEGGWPSNDGQIRYLRRLMRVLLEFEPSRVSKYARGIQWKTRDLEAAEPALTVGFDIVGYSTRPPEVQKHMIQGLNKVVKDTLEDLRLEPRLYVPTGDGMLMVFEAGVARHIVPLMRLTQEGLRVVNSGDRTERRFTVRSAIHAGPVFAYSDVNENLNFAGNGLNILARVLDFADDWHVIASEEGFRHMGQPYQELSGLFHPLGTRIVKHGGQVTIYNVFDNKETGSFGNPSAPKS